VFDRLREVLDEADDMTWSKALTVVRCEADNHGLGEREVRDQRKVLIGWASSAADTAKGISVLEDVIGEKIFDQVRVLGQDWKGKLTVRA
jgi:hypothetical protein